MKLNRDGDFLAPVPEADLHELWSRMVFSELVRNTDDHLRNHGFLLTSKGWRLAPTMNSFNHAEFVSVLDWMYRTMAGIRPNPKEGGFDDFILQPLPDGRIRTVEADYRTPSYRA